MKKVLITGANSYIGTSFEKYVADHYSSDLSVDTIDMIDGSWREKDFSLYDVVYHVAGIAHADVGNVSDEVKAKYYAINTDLAIETCKKAKNESYKQNIILDIKYLVKKQNVVTITTNIDNKISKETSIKEDTSESILEKSLNEQQVKAKEEFKDNKLKEILGGLYVRKEENN